MASSTTGTTAGRGLSSELVLSALGAGILIRGALAVAGVDVPKRSGWLLALACAWAWGFIGWRFLADTQTDGIERDVIVRAAALAFIVTVAMIGSATMWTKAFGDLNLAPGPVFLGATVAFLAAEVSLRRRLLSRG